MPSQERVGWARFRVAALSVAALAILSVLLYLLTGGTLFSEKVTLYLFVADATGLARDSPVRVDGIGVGKVKALELTTSGDRARVVKLTMQIERERLASISADSYAQISADTLIGDKFVDITSGRSPDHIPAGGVLTYKEQPELFKTLDISQFEKRLHDMDALLDDLEQGKGAIGQAVQSDVMYNNLRRRFAEFQTAVHDAASASGAVGKTVYTEDLYRKWSQPFLDLDRSLAAIQSGQGTAGQLLRDSGTYESARQSIRDLGGAIADLHSSDFMRSDSLYNDWNRSLVKLIRSADEMNANPMLTRTDFYENLTGMALGMRDGVKEFRENPRKFLRLKVF
ncbi:MAG TPA: MlaD family protein [Bryobacteraceae bacterium]|jgi:phospholipid/cholesterol/gamma-HCH transport system substrate-binding protein